MTKLAEMTTCFHNITMHTPFGQPQKESKFIKNSLFDDDLGPLSSISVCRVYPQVFEETQTRSEVFHWMT